MTENSILSEEKATDGLLVLALSLVCCAALDRLLPHSGLHSLICKARFCFFMTRCEKDPDEVTDLA